MDIGVTISAVGAYVLEDKAGVAAGAGNLYMHATQRISRLVMIELRIGANRLPACVCMAVLTGRRDRTMGIGYFGLWASDAGPIAARLLL